MVQTWPLQEDPATAGTANQLEKKFRAWEQLRSFLMLRFRLDAYTDNPNELCGNEKDLLAL